MDISKQLAEAITNPRTVARTITAAGEASFSVSLSPVSTLFEPTYMVTLNGLATTFAHYDYDRAVECYHKICRKLL